MVVKPCSHVPTQTQIPIFGLLKFSIVLMAIGFQPVTISTTLNLYRTEFKINSVSVHVNKALLGGSFPDVIEILKLLNSVPN